MCRSPSPSSKKGIYGCLWHQVFPRFEMPYGIGFTSFVVLVEAMKWSKVIAVRALYLL